MSPMQIVISENVVMGRSVKARELHLGLEVREKYADWIKRRLAECQFTEGVDYQSFSEISEKSKSAKRGRNRQDCILTVDSAKHICLLERTEIGRKIRQYFIDVEKMVYVPQRGMAGLSPGEQWVIGLMRKMGALDALERIRPCNQWSEEKSMRRSSFVKGGKKKGDAKIVNQFVMNFFPSLEVAK